MIGAKAAPGDVYGKVPQADPYLKAMRDMCTKPLTPECTFSIGLNDYFSARMMFNSGRYYARHDDKEKAGQILRELTARFTEETYPSDVARARTLLGYLAAWDTFSPGWKAYYLDDYAAALKEFIGSDDPKSMYEVARMYYLGDGVPADPKKAVEWYLKAADKGFAPAQYRLGMLYVSGDGVLQDRKEARKWIEKAADQRFEPARNALVNLRDVEVEAPASTDTAPLQPN
jgi:TPR repeat protein